MSCSPSEKICNIINQDTIECDVSEVSVDEALHKLEIFLSDAQMTKTKSGIERKVSTIDVHYSTSQMTIDDVPMPDAYLVNFENEEGFAILGANSSIAPIIAVIEEGNTDWNNIFMPLTDYEPLSYASDNSDLRSLILGPGVESELILPLCVESAMKGRSNQQINARSSAEVTTPLLDSTYNFGQNVTYCHKENKKFVTNGCASTAIAMIMAYKKFPRMVVDNNLLNFDNYNTKDAKGIRYRFSDDIIYLKLDDYFTNSSSIPTALTNQEKLDLLEKIDPTVIDSHGIPSVNDEIDYYRTRYKVTSAVYYTLDNSIRDWDGTGIVPNAVVNGLEDIGFSNVSKKQSRELNSEQIATITNMLLDKKPVLICGWSLWSLKKSHYWVIDGIKTNDDTILIHCNWGDNGKNTGWFASDCIRRDAQVEVKSSDSDNEWNNLVVFSYDVPGMVYLRINTFYDEYRITY